MPRRSLRPQLNQIRAWVRQGRTDAWIAHQLEATVQDIEQFKRQNELVSDEDAAAGQAAGDFEEIDLRAEDDALIAAELEAAAREAEREREEAEAAERARAEQAERERAERAERGEEEEESGDGEAGGEGADEDEEGRKPRRRSRRGGRGRRSPAQANTPLEGTFDHGEEGYGLWLDPAVQDNPVYAEHWAGHRPVEVLIEEDQIVIRRVGNDD
jgi:hypothetical protein